MASLVSKSVHLQTADATSAFAQSLAPHLKAGDTILLSGELGSGKTHFARALIQARLAAGGRQEDIPSPTFTLVQSYGDGVCEIWHADLYRLTRVDDIVELGLLDALDTCICLIEWPDRMGPLLPDQGLHIELCYAQAPDARTASISWRANRWNDVTSLIGGQVV